MKTILLAYLLSFAVNDSSSCMCGYSFEFNYSDFLSYEHIIYGKIINAYSVEDKIYYEFKIIEDFKGDLKNDLVYVFEEKIESNYGYDNKNCNLNLKIDDYWILCSNDNLSNIYKINGCQRNYNEENKDFQFVYNNLKRYSNLEDGFYSFKYSNDSTSSIGYVVDNMPDGEWLFYYPDGKIRIKILYNKGLKVIMERYLNHPDYSIKKSFYDEKGILDSTVFIYK